MVARARGSNLLFLIFPDTLKYCAELASEVMSNKSRMQFRAISSLVAQNNNYLKYELLKCTLATLSIDSIPEARQCLLTGSFFRYKSVHLVNKIHSHNEQ